jgi:hypothetical protein
MYRVEEEGERRCQELSEDGAFIKRRWLFHVGYLWDLGDDLDVF